MARQRREARGERERLAAARTAELSERARRSSLDRARRQRRVLLWKRVRLWQHGPQFRRRRSAWGVIAVVALLVLLVAYLLTGSISDVVGTTLVLVLASPLVVALVFDRSRQ